MLHCQELVPVRVAMVFHAARLLETCARTTMSFGGGSGRLSRRARRPSSTRNVGTPGDAPGGGDRYGPQTFFSNAVFLASNGFHSPQPAVLVTGS